MKLSEIGFEFNAPSSTWLAGCESVNDSGRVRVSLPRVLTSAVVLSYVLALAAGAVTFTIWTQITDLAGQRVSPFDLDWAAQAHALRYSLIYPVLAIAEGAAIAPDRVFSWVVGAAILGTAHLVDRVRSLATHERRPWRWGYLGIVTWFVTLSLLMNGRLAFAFLGMALLLWALVRRQVGATSNVRTILWFPIVLWLASVSSGTFSVALGTIAIWSLSVIIGRFPVVRLRDAAVLLPLLAGGLAIAPLFELYFTKNVAFYGGGLDGFFNMLNHGPGVLISPIGPVLGAPLAMIALGLGAFVVLLLLTRAGPMAPPAISVVVAGAVGVFGYSTLMMALPGLSALFGAALTPHLKPR